MKEEVDRLEKKSIEPGFWNDRGSAELILKRKKKLEDKLSDFNAVCKLEEEAGIMFEMAKEAENNEEGQQERQMLLEEAEEALEKIVETVERMTVETLLSGEYDSNNAILNIHAGSGGVDAQDWAEMLLRMYLRWGEIHGCKVNLLYVQDGGGYGIKSATILFEGKDAYGYLSTEKGVHRLVRISPFDSSGRRHTSFAAVDVMPEIDNDVSIDIEADDLRIDTFRASGAGGQHVNMTDSAVRITHIPTNIVVSCQNERSQHQNKDMAMKLLASKLMELAMQEHKENLKELAGDYSQITWGSQIRSYVIHPYTMVKDHRTNLEVGNVDKVLDGKIDAFIFERLRQLSIEN